MKRLFFVISVLLFVFSATAEPFVWSLQQEQNKAILKVTVAPEYYFYDNTLEIRVTGADGKTLSPTVRAATVLFNDEFEGETAIYPTGTYQWQFTGLPPFSATVSWQGCGKGTEDTPPICLMPQTLTLNSEIPLEKLEGELSRALLPLERFETVSTHSGMMSKAEFLQFIRTGKAAETAGTTASRGITALLLLTLFGGILLNFTPCVLPMIPINLAIIGAKGAGRAAGFRRGLCYGTGMAAAYGILGLAVILAGATFGELNSQSWFNFAVGAIFAVLACGMFGFLNVDLSRFSPAVRSRISGTREVAAFGLGAVSALLAGACVAPVVIGTLLAAAQFYQAGHTAALGLPFLLGVGMGLPWPFAGAGLAVLPKPGKFMIHIKHAFGVIILAAGCYYLWLGFSLLPGKYSAESELLRLKDAMIRSEASGREIVIDFWATWCKNCKAMERDVLQDPEVREALEKVEFVRFQAEKPGDPAIAALLAEWKIPGLPAFVILRSKSSGQ